MWRWRVRVFTAAHSRSHRRGASRNVSRGHADRWLTDCETLPLCVFISSLFFFFFHYVYSIISSLTTRNVKVSRWGFEFIRRVGYYRARHNTETHLIKPCGFFTVAGWCRRRALRNRAYLTRTRGYLFNYLHALEILKATMMCFGKFPGSRSTCVCSSARGKFVPRARARVTKKIPPPPFFFSSKFSKCIRC